MTPLLRKGDSLQCKVVETGKADWKEAFSDGIDPEAQAGTGEEVGKKSLAVRSIN